MHEMLFTRPTHILSVFIQNTMDRVVFRLAAPTRDLGELKAALHLPGFHLLIDKHRTYEVLRASWFERERAFEVRSYPYEGLTEFTVSAATPDGIRDMYLQCSARATAAARTCKCPDIARVYAAGLKVEVDEVYLAPVLREYRMRISARSCPVSDFGALLSFWRNMYPEVVPSARLRSTMVDRGVYVMQAFEMFRPPSYDPISVRFELDPSPTLELCVPLCMEAAGRELVEALAACGKFRQESRVICTPTACFTSSGDTCDLEASLRAFTLEPTGAAEPIEKPESLEVVVAPSPRPPSPPSSPCCKPPPPPATDTGLPDLTVDGVLDTILG